MKDDNQAASNTTPIILYGIDQHQKFRAALFPATQSDISSRAAEKMNLNIVHVNTKELEDLSQQLEPARIYEAGKGFIPYISKGIYGKIVSLAGPGRIENANVPTDGALKAANDNSKTNKRSTKLPAEKLSSRAKIEGLPKDWKDIRVGHLVIAQASKKDGWWEAIVVSVNRNVLTLRWRDYPKLPVLSRHRSTVALLRHEMN